MIEAIEENQINNKIELIERRETNTPKYDYLIKLLDKIF